MRATDKTFFQRAASHSNKKKVITKKHRFHAKEDFLSSNSNKEKKLGSNNQSKHKSMGAPSSKV